MTTATRTTERLNAILSPQEAGAITQTFRRMEIAEREIARAKEEFPLLATQIHESFRALCPTEPLRRLSDKVYRHHCRELLERVASGRDLRPGTDAELVAVISEASLAAPPDRATTYLYWQLFERVFPGEAGVIREDLGPVHADDYDRVRAKELEQSLRRKLAASRTAT